MAKVVIFGILDTAELAHYYLTHDSKHQVVAFTVNQEYIKEPFFHGLPVVPFEEVTMTYPPDDFKMFVAMTGKKMNTLREKVYHSAKSLGYELITYVSSKATLFNNEIGDNCFILENNTIQPFTKIGNNVTLWSGNNIGHHGVINDHIFFASHVVMAGHCNIGSYSFFGVNSTLRDFITIAPGTLVGMSASITKRTQEWGVYIGNPAKLLEGKKSIDIY